MIKNRIQYQREEVQDHQSTPENLKIPVRNRLQRKDQSRRNKKWQN